MSVAREPLLAPGLSVERIHVDIADHALRPGAAKGWWLLFVLALAAAALLVAGIWHAVATGIGVFGNDMPVAWAFPIANYVWWIAIGMAGTFISAALYLTRQEWRAPLARYAETMTVIAVAVSGLFPILHLGRPWFAYWLLPYPNRMGTWPQWRSALTWDFYAIVAYLSVSILYWYAGLLPDLATLRDRARTRGRQVFYGLLALGWRGEARHWQRYETLNRLLAGVAVPLVFSVHSMVALDFSEGLLPGWHTSLFPPFFIAGALFSGCAMALVLGIPLRRWLHLQAYIRPLHLDYLARLMLAAGLVVAYSYAMEMFTAFYSGERSEIDGALRRLAGPYAWMYYLVLGCNVLAAQALWSPRVRRSPRALFAIGVVVLVGMWFERLELILHSLYRDFLPSAEGRYAPTVWDIAVLAGSLGLFLALFLCFVRLLPVLSLVELRRLLLRERAEGRA